MCRRSLAFTVFLSFQVVATNVFGGELARLRLSSGLVEWLPQVDAEELNLRLAGPDGAVRSWRFAAGTAPTLSLFDAKGHPLPDGLYSYELRATPRLPAELRDRLQAARAAGDEAALRRLQGEIPQPLVQAGNFRIAEGAVVTRERAEREPGSIAKDQMVPDDLIVDGKGCIGLGCANGESFGAEALRLKQSVVRLRFEDTSGAASGFPTRDWQLAVNDPGSGGGDRFSIEDLTAGRTPFTIRGNAPTNALVVDASGKIGLRTATPAQDLHVASSNTPALRLEQTTGGGLPARVWDLGANDTSFFVRDVSNGSVLPLRIQAGAPASSFEVLANGNVGIGTSTPGRSFEVSRSGVVDVGFYNSSGTHAGGGPANPSRWFFQVDNDPNRTFKISKEGTGGAELIVDQRLDANGPTFKVDGSVQATNVVFSSSRSLKDDIRPLDTQEVLSRLGNLPIAEWRFKQGPDVVRHVGPMAEDFHAAFHLGQDGETLSVTDVSGVALAAIQALLQRVRTLEEANRELIERLQDLSSLEARIVDLERALAAAPQRRPGSSGSNGNPR